MLCTRTKTNDLSLDPCIAQEKLNSAVLARDRNTMEREATNMCFRFAWTHTKKANVHCPRSAAQHTLLREKETFGEGGHQYAIAVCQDAYAEDKNVRSSNALLREKDHKREGGHQNPFAGIPSTQPQRRNLPFNTLQANLPGEEWAPCAEVQGQDRRPQGEGEGAHPPPPLQLLPLHTPTFAVASWPAPGSSAWHREAPVAGEGRPDAAHHQHHSHREASPGGPAWASPRCEGAARSRACWPRHAPGPAVGVRSWP